MQQAAQQFIDAYFAGFPVPRVHRLDVADAQASGVVKTIGRRRPVPELTSFRRAGAERIAVNMPIQARPPTSSSAR